ncbi:hypothetical protein BH18ACI2_BH18ACI2_23650 [soil metagenome]
MKMCVEEGILQACLDGELSPETSQAVTAHLTACAACGARAREAEAELSLFASVMSPAAVSVPTERLRARLDAAIAETLQSEVAAGVRQEARWRVWLNGLAAALTFAPGKAAAFASLLIAVVLSIFFATKQLSPSEIGRDEIAVITVPAPANGLPILSPMPVLSLTVDVAVRPESSDMIDGRARIEVIKNQRSASRKAAGDSARRGMVRQSDAPVFLPGEKTYLTAIASLTTTIESGGPQSLPPTLRAEYERNLAVVNQAIISTRVAARRNPQDTDVQEFLRTAYQNKVELLSAVAEQSQLASVKD